MGQAAGKALADIIYGYQSPSGRLVTTMYPNSYLKQVQLEDMRMRPGGETPGRTYRFYDGPVVYPFGHGSAIWETILRVL
jgi:xylan 1,4-beta-xylosidase